METINKIINLKTLSEEYCFNKNKLLEIKDDTAPDPCEKANESLVRIYLAKCIKQLTDKEQCVIILKHGLFGYKLQSYRNIADLYNYKTHETIRQIEKRAMRRLAHPRFKLEQLYINEI